MIVNAFLSINGRSLLADQKKKKKDSCFSTKALLGMQNLSLLTPNLRKIVHARYPFFLYMIYLISKTTLGSNQKKGMNIERDVLWSYLGDSLG